MTVKLGDKTYHNNQLDDLVHDLGRDLRAGFVSCTVRLVCSSDMHETDISRLFEKIKRIEPPLLYIVQLTQNDEIKYTTESFYFENRRKQFAIDLKEEIVAARGHQSTADRPAVIVPKYKTALFDQGAKHTKPQQQLQQQQQQEQAQEKESTQKSLPEYKDRPSVNPAYYNPKDPGTLLTRENIQADDEIREFYNLHMASVENPPSLVDIWDNLVGQGSSCIEDKRKTLTAVTRQAMKEVIQNYKEFCLSIIPDDLPIVTNEVGEITARFKLEETGYGLLRSSVDPTTLSVDEQKSTLEPYKLCILPDDGVMEKNKVYLSIKDGKLAYSVIPPFGEPVERITNIKAPARLEPSTISQYKQAIMDLASQSGHIRLYPHVGYIQYENQVYYFDQQELKRVTNDKAQTIRALMKSMSTDEFQLVSAHDTKDEVQRVLCYSTDISPTEKHNKTPFTIRLSKHVIRPEDSAYLKYHGKEASDDFNQHLQTIKNPNASLQNTQAAFDFFSKSEPEDDDDKRIKAQLGRLIKTKFKGQPPTTFYLGLINLLMAGDKAAVIVFLKYLNDLKQWDSIQLFLTNPDNYLYWASQKGYNALLKLDGLKGHFTPSEQRWWTTFVREHAKTGAKNDFEDLFQAFTALIDNLGQANPLPQQCPFEHALNLHMQTALGRFDFILRQNAPKDPNKQKNIQLSHIKGMDLGPLGDDYAVRYEHQTLVYEDMKLTPEHAVLFDTKTQKLSFGYAIPDAQAFADLMCLDGQFKRVNLLDGSREQDLTELDINAFFYRYVKQQTPTYPLQSYIDIVNCVRGLDYNLQENATSNHLSLKDKASLLYSLGMASAGKRNCAYKPQDPMEQLPKFLKAMSCFAASIGSPKEGLRYVLDCLHKAGFEIETSPKLAELTTLFELMPKDAASAKTLLPLTLYLIKQYGHAAYALIEHQKKRCEMAAQQPAIKGLDFACVVTVLNALSLDKKETEWLQHPPENTQHFITLVSLIDDASEDKTAYKQEIDKLLTKLSCLPTSCRDALLTALQDINLPASKGLPTFQSLDTMIATIQTMPSEQIKEAVQTNLKNTNTAYGKKPFEGSTLNLTNILQNLALKFELNNMRSHIKRHVAGIFKGLLFEKIATASAPMATQTLVQAASEYYNLLIDKGGKPKEVVDLPVVLKQLDAINKAMKDVLTNADAAITLYNERIINYFIDEIQNVALKEKRALSDEEQVLKQAVPRFFNEEKDLKVFLQGVCDAECKKPIEKSLGIFNLDADFQAFLLNQLTLSTDPKKSMAEVLETYGEDLAILTQFVNQLGALRNQSQDDFLKCETILNAPRNQGLIRFDHLTRLLTCFIQQKNISVSEQLTIFYDRLKSIGTPDISRVSGLTKWKNIFANLELLLQQDNLEPGAIKFLFTESLNQSLSSENQFLLQDILDLKKADPDGRIFKQFLTFVSSVTKQQNGSAVVARTIHMVGDKLTTHPEQLPVFLSQLFRCIEHMVNKEQKDQADLDRLESELKAYEALLGQLPSDRTQAEQWLTMLTSLTEGKPESIEMSKLLNLARVLDTPYKLRTIHPLFKTPPYPPIDDLIRVLTKDPGTIEAYVKRFDLRPYGDANLTSSEKIISQAEANILQGFELDLESIRKVIGEHEVDGQLVKGITQYLDEQGLSESQQTNLVRQLSYVNSMGKDNPLLYDDGYNGLSYELRETTRHDLKWLAQRLMGDLKQEESKPVEAQDTQKVLKLNLQLLAVMRELYCRATFINPNSTQLLSVILAMNHPTNLLLEIDTGEGKSVTTGLFAAWRCSKERTVLVPLPNRDLVKQDYHEQKNKYFFKLLGMESAVIESDSPRGSYQVGGINYGAFGDLSIDKLRSEVLDFNKKYTTDIIYDEADTILDERTQYNLSTPKSAVGDSYHNPQEWMYGEILEFIASNRAFQRTTYEGNEAPWDHDRGVFELSAHLWSKAEKAEQKEQVSALSLDDLSVWIISACEALSLDKGRDYDIPEKATIERMKDGTPRETYVAIPISESGVPLIGASYLEGRHQFLHKFLNEGVKNFTEKFAPILAKRLQVPDVAVGKFPVPAETMRVATESGNTFLSSFLEEAEDARIIALTGTTGKQDERLELNKKFNLLPFKIPPHRENKRQELPAKLVKNKYLDSDYELALYKESQRERDMKAGVIYLSQKGDKIAYSIKTKAGTRLQMETNIEVPVAFDLDELQKLKDKIVSVTNKAGDTNSTLAYDLALLTPNTVIKEGVIYLSQKGANIAYTVKNGDEVIKEKPTDLRVPRRFELNKLKALKTEILTFTTKMGDTYRRTIQDKMIIAGIDKHAETQNGKRQPILVVAKDVNHARAQFFALRAQYGEKKVQLITGIETKKELEELKRKAGEPGMITVGTKFLGRGTDIKPKHARGLFVIQTYLDTPRNTRQIMGRSARKGQVGKYMAIYAEDKFKFPTYDLLNFSQTLSGPACDEQIKRLQSELNENAAAERYFTQEVDDIQQVLLKQFDAWMNVLVGNDKAREPYKFRILVLRAQLIQNLARAWTKKLTESESKTSYANPYVRRDEASGKLDTESLKTLLKDYETNPNSGVLSIWKKTQEALIRVKDEIPDKSDHELICLNFLENDPLAEELKIRKLRFQKRRFETERTHPVSENRSKRLVKLATNVPGARLHFDESILSKNNQADSVINEYATTYLNDIYEQSPALSSFDSPKESMPNRFNRLVNAIHDAVDVNKEVFEFHSAAVECIDLYKRVRGVDGIQGDSEIEQKVEKLTSTCIKNVTLPLATDLMKQLAWSIDKNNIYRLVLIDSNITHAAEEIYRAACELPRQIPQLTADIEAVDKQIEALQAVASEEALNQLKKTRVEKVAEKKRLVGNLFKILTKNQMTLSNIWYYFPFGEYFFGLKDTRRAITEAMHQFDCLEKAGVCSSEVHYDLETHTTSYEAGKCLAYLRNFNHDLDTLYEDGPVVQALKDIQANNDGLAVVDELLHHLKRLPANDTSLKLKFRYIDVLPGLFSRKSRAKERLIEQLELVQRKILLNEPGVPVRGRAFLSKKESAIKQALGLQSDMLLYIRPGHTGFETFFDLVIEGKEVARVAEDLKKMDEQLDEYSVIYDSRCKNNEAKLASSKTALAFEKEALDRDSQALSTLESSLTKEQLQKINRAVQASNESKSVVELRNAVELKKETISHQESLLVTSKQTLANMSPQQNILFKMVGNLSNRAFDDVAKKALRQTKKEKIANLKEEITEKEKIITTQREELVISLRELKRASEKEIKTLESSQRVLSDRMKQSLSHRVLKRFDSLDDLLDFQAKLTRAKQSAPCETEQHSNLPAPKSEPRP